MNLFSKLPVPEAVRDRLRKYIRYTPVFKKRIPVLG